MRSIILSLLVFGALAASSAAQPEDPAPGQDAGGSLKNLKKDARRARTLFEQGNYPVAAALARQVFAQSRWDGSEADELRILLCKAKAAGADVGEPAAGPPGSSESGGPDSKPIAIGGGVRRPEKIYGTMPDFDRKARESGAPGAVIVSAVIDEDGCVQDPEIERGSNTHYDQAVLDAFRGWVFRPALYQGKPCKTSYTLTTNVHVQ